MRWVIVGAGGIGGTLGARLFEASESVTLIARGRHGERLRQDGLSFVSASGRRRLAIPTVKHPAALRFRGDEIVLLCTKTQQSAAALDDLRAAAGDRVPIICAQNGVANEALAQRRFEFVYAMVVMLPATHLQPGEVVSFAEGAGGILDSGCYPAGVDERVEQFCSTLTSAGFSATPRADVMRFKYGKLLMNLGNAVQALCGRIAEDAHARLGRLLADEALRCYAAAGIECASEEEIAAVRKPLRLHQLSDVERGGGSSWQSLVRGTGEVEADYLNGEITGLGRRFQVPTPANLVCQREVVKLARTRGAAGSLSLATLERLIAEETAR